MLADSTKSALTGDLLAEPSSKKGRNVGRQNRYKPQVNAFLDVKIDTNVNRLWVKQGVDKLIADLLVRQLACQAISRIVLGVVFLPVE